MFKECAHPDEKTRNMLSRELGLHPRQIKFWFQNRRTQMKVLLFIYCKILLGFDLVNSIIKMLFLFVFLFRHNMKDQIIVHWGLIMIELDVKI